MSMQPSSQDTSHNDSRPNAGASCKAHANGKAADAQCEETAAPDPDDDAGPEPSQANPEDTTEPEKSGISAVPALNVTVVDSVSSNQPDSEVQDWADIVRTASLTLRESAVTSADLTIALVDDRQMAELNEAHLHHQGPTDVLTFDMSPPRKNGESPAVLEGEPVLDGEPVIEGEAVIEGEIVISIDTARRESLRRGHSLRAEVALYAVHGLLHLLGYDDHEEDAAAAMHAREDELLMLAGWGRVYAQNETGAADAGGCS